MVVECLSRHDVHVWLIGIWIDGELPLPHLLAVHGHVLTEANRRPVQAAVRGSIQVFLHTVAGLRGERIHDGVTWLPDA
jgi:hypothetical protein